MVLISMSKIWECYIHDTLFQIYFNRILYACQCSIAQMDIQVCNVVIIIHYSKLQVHFTDFTDNVISPTEYLDQVFLHLRGQNLKI